MPRSRTAERMTLGTTALLIALTRTRQTGVGQIQPKPSDSFAPNLGRPGASASSPEADMAI